MAIYLKDIIRDRSVLTQVITEQADCCNCGVKLQETITGKRHTPKGDTCSDCYYEMLGDMIEKHPIASGGIRRS
jgi:hypothetical protein